MKNLFILLLSFVIKVITIIISSFILGMFIPLLICIINANISTDTFIESFSSPVTIFWCVALTLVSFMCIMGIIQNSDSKF